MPKKLDCKHITSVTQLRRCGYGVDAVVKLKKSYINKLSGENIGPRVGTKGKVTGSFGAQPTIKWVNPGKYGRGPQVVPTEFLRVTMRSGKPVVIATISIEKLKKFKDEYRTVDIKDSKVLVWKNETIYDDGGFEDGDASYELRGKIKGDKVEFTSTRIDMSGVPHRHRWMIRNDFDSHDPKEYFSELLED